MLSYAIYNKIVSRKSYYYSILFTLSIAYTCLLKRYIEQEPPTLILLAAFYTLHSSRIISVDILANSVICFKSLLALLNKN